MSHIFNRIKNHFMICFGLNVKKIDIIRVTRIIGISYGIYWVSALITGIINEKRHPYNAFTSIDYILRNTDLTGKTAIVTGASSGIGCETARVLANKGCKVYMACKNIIKAENVRDKMISKSNNNIDPNNLQILKVDLGSLQSVYDFSKNVINKNIKVNYLINNAGVMGTPKYCVTKDNIEYQFGINYLGHYYMTKLLLPILKQNKGRIINITSLFHSFGFYDKSLKLFDYCIKNKCFMGSMKNIYNPVYGYGLSKSCQIIFSKYINKTFNNDGIYSIAVHPGVLLFTSLLREVRFIDIFYVTLEWYLYPHWVIKHNKLSYSFGVTTIIKSLTLTNNEIENSKTPYYFNCRSWDISNKSIARNDDNSDIIIHKLIQLSDILIQNAGFQLSL